MKQKKKKTIPDKRIPEFEVVVWTHEVGRRFFSSKVLWHGKDIKEAREIAKDKLAEEAWKFCCEVFEANMTKEMPDNIQTEELNFRVTVQDKRDSPNEIRAIAPKIHYSCGNSSIKVTS